MKNEMLRRKYFRFKELEMQKLKDFMRDFVPSGTNAVVNANDLQELLRDYKETQRRNKQKDEQIEQLKAVINTLRAKVALYEIDHIEIDLKG